MTSRKTSPPRASGVVPRQLRTVLAAMLIAWPLPQALAQTSDSRAISADNWTFTVGAGVGVKPDYEGSEDYELVPVPLLRAEQGPVFAQLFRFHATSNFINHPNWRLGPSAKFRPGYSDVSDKRVDNLRGRGDSIELGAKGGYVFQFGGGEGSFMPRDSSIDLAVEFLHDVSSEHEGWLLTPSATFATPLSDSWSFESGVEVEYASGSYMSQYFSINSQDAANSGLDNYDADADFKHVALNLGTSYTFLDHWALNLVAQWKMMTGDADDSPVVDDQGETHQGFLGAVVSYTW